MEAALGERIGVSDDEWALIGSVLPSERGRCCRPAGDSRPYLEGMVWIARTGVQWRHLPEEYGKWNSVLRRYRRWVVTGVFEAMLEALAVVFERDVSADMIDSTVVPARHCTVGLKKGLGIRGGRPFARRLHDQGCPELVEGLHARCDGQGRPLCFVLTPGQTHDVKGFGLLFGMLADQIEALLADKGYDADAIRQEHAKAKVEAVIPIKSNRRISIPHDREKYRSRNLVERLFGKLKN